MAIPSATAFVIKFHKKEKTEFKGKKGEIKYFLKRRSSSNIILTNAADVTNIFQSLWAAHNDNPALCSELRQAIYWLASRQRNQTQFLQ